MTDLGESWPEHELTPGDGVDLERLTRLLDTAVGADAPPELGLTQAALVVRHGEIVAERYGAAFHSELADQLRELAEPRTCGDLVDHEPAAGPDEPGPDHEFLSWSMAKSMLHAVIGFCVLDGLVDIAEPVPVPAWSSSGDERGALTWDDLLRMHSGLAWVEEYVEGRGSDVITMLFGDGAVDMAAFAEAKPLIAPPRTVHNYSSGTSNILARCVQRVLELDGPGIQRHLFERLFGPLGMTTASAEVDAAGTWVASSYVHATARDFARFGLLYLHDGVWNGTRLLPEGWVTHGRTLTPSDPEHAYGAHWWLANDGHDSFAAHGYEGQRIRCVPDLDLVIVRLGKTPAVEPAPPRDAVSLWVDQLVACFTR